MGTRDTELHSVRVEIEGVADAPGSSDPVVDPADGQTPPWVIGLAILIVGVVGAGVLLLRPMGDTAADGSEREPVDLAEEADGGQDAESLQGDTGDAIDAESEVAEAAIVPTRVLLDGGRAVQILAGDLGFFALIERAGVAPTMLRSIDGEDWFEVNSTVTSRGVENEQRLDWFSMSFTGELFVLRAAPVIQDSFPAGEVFTSLDGTNWQQLDGFGSLRDGGSTGFPVAFSEGSSFAFEFTGIDLLEDFLTEYTTLDIPSNGVCGITAGASVTGETIFNIGSCSGELVGPLDEAGTVGDVAAGDVFACMTELSNSLASRSLSFVRREIAGGPAVELFDLRPVALPLSLSNGSVVLPDAGPIDESLDRCIGLIDVPELADPAMVVVDARTDEITRWPFPDGAVFEGERFFSVQPLGEFELASGDVVLLTVYREALWALNLANGVWTGPLSSTAFESNGLGGAAAASASGDRVYLVDGAGLFVFDIAEDPSAAGLVVVNETLVPIDVSNAATIEFGGEILFADNAVVFFSDGVTVWTLEAPQRVE